MSTLAKPASLRRRIITTLLLAYLVLGVVLVLYIGRQMQDSKVHWQNTLSSIVMDQTNILSDAVTRRLSEISVLADVRSAVQLASHDPGAASWAGPGPSPEERLVPFLNVAYKDFGLSGVVLVDKDAVPVLSAGLSSETVPSLSVHIATALQGHRTVFVDAFEHEDGTQRVAYVAPIYLDNGGPAGALVATEDPTIALFPAARNHSTVTQAARSTIERRSVQGNTIYVQTLWNEDGSAAQSRGIPYASASVIDRAAADGKSAAAVVTSPDGVSRIMATAPVSSTGWGLVAAVTTSDALAEARTMAYLESFLGIAITTAFVVFISLQSERSRRIVSEATARNLARTNAEIERLSRIMNVTREVNQLISHETDIREVMASVCRHVLEVGDFQTSWIALCHDGSIAVTASAGATAAVPKTTIRISELEHGRACVVRALTTRQPVFVTVTDRVICAECEHRDNCTTSETFVGPLVAQGDVLGVLVIGSLTVHAVGSSERVALIELTDDVAFAIASQRVREQKVQAETALRQAQKMEAVGQLAGGVAHDFNNLLTGIIGNVDLALQQATDDASMKRSLQEAGMAARRAAELTGKLLAFGRKAIIIPSAVDVDHLIDDALVLLKRSLPASIHIVYDKNAGTWPVMADASQMTQVLLNLAINARDAMHGKGTLTIGAANSTIDDAYVGAHPYAHPGDYVAICVKDTGEGMTDEVKTHLFEPFFTTKPEGEGTGLGLSMAYGAVKQAGGWIGVESTLRKGSSLTVFLPRSTEAITNPAESAGTQQTMPRGAETILVVDDEEVVRTLARRVLERSGYAVLTAVDGEGAMKQFREHSGEIDLVISDLTMPGMTGLECLTAMRQIRPDVSFLLSSGYSADMAYQEFVHGSTASAGFLAKPYTPDELLATVRQVLDTASAARASQRGTAD
jgi:signal transduction histidine kinase/CheY-like chemotaxis protein